MTGTHTHTGVLWALNMAETSQLQNALPANPADFQIEIKRLNTLQQQLCKDMTTLAPASAANSAEMTLLNTDLRPAERLECRCLQTANLIADCGMLFCCPSLSCHMLHILSS